jgi:hypothetical protein
MGLVINKYAAAWAKGRRGCSERGQGITTTNETEEADDA